MNVAGNSYLVGNVGIGTLSSSHKLDVNGDARVAYDIHFGRNTGSRWIIHSTQHWNPKSPMLTIAPDGNGSDYFWDRNLSIHRNGSVSIGTNDYTVNGKEYKLAVKGSISAQEIVVTNVGWADYVFKPGYDLKPLNVVEKFIKENNHLPNIPSEKEVAKNGISIGDMQAKLLEKIEELTLYTIQQQKDISELKSALYQKK